MNEESLLYLLFVTDEAIKQLETYEQFSIALSA